MSTNQRRGAVRCRVLFLVRGGRGWMRIGHRTAFVIAALALLTTVFTARVGAATLRVAAVAGDPPAAAVAREMKLLLQQRVRFLGKSWVVGAVRCQGEGAGNYFCVTRVNGTPLYYNATFRNGYLSYAISR